MRTTRFDRGSRSNNRRWRGFGEVIGGHENALRRPPLVPAGSLRHFDFTVRFGNGEEEERGGEIVRVRRRNGRVDCFFFFLSFFVRFNLVCLMTSRSKRVKLIMPILQFPTSSFLPNLCFFFFLIQ